MKKLLSVLLTLSMLLTLFVVPTVTASAADRVTIGANDTEVTVYGVTYKVIRTADDFKAMTGSANYILAADIDLGGHKLSATGGIITTWKGILDGNGYSVTGFDISGNDSGLFQVIDPEAVITIQNITFGSETAPITGAPAGNGSNGVVFGKFKGKSVTFINCDSYVKMEKTDKAAMSAFVGQPDLAGSGSACHKSTCTLLPENQTLLNKFIKRTQNRCVGKSMPPNQRTDTGERI